MNKHTAGPWAVEAVRYGGARIVSGRAFDKAAKPVAWVAADETVEDPSTGQIREVMSDEAEGNASLIGAAPGLLAELRECAAALQALIDEKPMLAAKCAGSTTLGNTLAAARSAITKAGGA